MKHFLHWLAKPVRENFTFFILIFIQIGILEVYVGISLIYQLTYSFNWAVINVTATSIIISYIFSLIRLILPHRLKTSFTYFTLFLTTLHFTSSLFLVQMYGTTLNIEIANIILNSNPTEIKEYLSMYLSISNILYLLTILIGGYIIYRFIKPMVTSYKCNSVVISFILIVCAILAIRRPIYFTILFPYNYITSFNQNKVPNLSDTFNQIQIKRLKESHPQNIVLIIGESFSKSHSSLYGYNKTTNPLLAQYKKDSLLYVYSNVTSPAQHTIACFQRIMSTYNSETKDSIPWYECTTLVNIMKKANYKTFWFSNQQKRGLNDNIPTRFAEQCDTNKFSTTGKQNSYDQEVITLVQPILQDSAKYNFYVFHLMGSHSIFKKRYPESFNHFKPEDYSNRPKHQQKLLAEYDNSILYNDSVVYEIMRLFKDKEAIAFYFSDHAIDVFESSDEYIGHANMTNPKSIEAGSKIPFMIYTSPLFKQNFPKETQQIKQCAEQPFRTDKMIYTIMDIVGIEFKEKKEGKTL